ncbi:2-deoxy-D-gluconate 3-dehydrogenase [Anaerotruncus sp. AF02-27]|uniref:2-dehydro-3-deoxy-D-gluconate 5-dehydrogenase KduD n=1 Tax=Anaerotruncus TaxID=244127 RepID=UPI000E4D8AC8|nr:MULTISPECIES: 2-dehydro-3-deoxy-D-gluconate 5-dehydrogenase KduD [Anaerotruncus]RGX54079.1 2-deoxy-D-gluconate 3-dehydrogenase [Anaerotruncus sp. AF02-27]
MILDSFRLDGKVAIITGARTGIGQGIALAMAEAGADVVGVGNKPMPEIAEQIRALGRGFTEISADLTRPCPELYDRVISGTLNAYGRVDILVNNAGIIRRCDAIDFNETDWDDVMNINLKTLFFLSQAAARQMVKQQSGGKIVNIASMLSYQGGIRVPSYTASKSGVMGLTRLLANEWAKYGINVNAIAPGYIDTNNTEALKKDPVRSAEILGRIPAGRWGTPRDMAGTAVFLASEASSYMQGFTVALDGGWLAR